MPMVVKIVGSTPTARTINESEVVGVLDTEQNKQIYETGREVQTLRFAKELQSLKSAHIAEVEGIRHKVTAALAKVLTHLPVSFYKQNTIIDG